MTRIVELRIMTVRYVEEQDDRPPPRDTHGIELPEPRGIVKAERQVVQVRKAVGS